MNYKNIRFLAWLLTDHKYRKVTPLPKQISDRMARDIGMSKVELEKHRRELPSQSSGRPLL